MSKITIIKCNLNERIKVQEYFFKKGYTWKDGHNDIRYYLADNIIYLFIDNKSKYITWNEDGHFNRYSDYDTVIKTTAKSFFRNLKLEKINE